MTTCKTRAVAGEPCNVNGSYALRARSGWSQSRVGARGWRL